jgi:hypothetical protein
MPKNENMYKKEYCESVVIPFSYARSYDSAMVIECGDTATADVAMVRSQRSQNIAALAWDGIIYRFFCSTCWGLTERRVVNWINMMNSFVLVTFKASHH